MLSLYDRFPDPIEIASIEVLAFEGRHFLRTTSTEGWVGIAITNQWLRRLLSVVQGVAIPFFLGKDARDLERLVDEVYTTPSNYKLAGLALWSSVGYVELSIWDMLGRAAGVPVCDLVGPVLRREIPVYLSSGNRDTTPEQEVALLARRLEESGASAIKVKIGGRMSRNADAYHGRSEGLVSLARRELGDGTAIYVDANGSYDAAHAIEVGHMLEAHGVGFYEEPCPFDEYDQTQAVADALEIPVAGGEQDTSAARFRWMIERRGVDLVQPDVVYNGGLIRTLRVAIMAQEAGMPITPHCPKADPNSAYMLHFAAVTPNLGPHQEYHYRGARPVSWYRPTFDARDGALPLPDGPGWGVEYDPAIWDAAERL